MLLKDLAMLLIGLVVFVCAVAVFALIGAISFGVAATVIAGVVYLLGVASLATAKALWLTIIAIGAVLGVLQGLLAMVAHG